MMNDTEHQDLKLRKVQLACLNILKKFKEVCEQNNLRYFLAYGTLLGAIRHKGYIPWDDDIDVWMPRSDMEQFLRIANTEMRPYVINYYTIQNDSSFKYRNHPCIEDHSFQIGFSLGGKIVPGYIWIDIIPLDGMPENQLVQSVHCIKIFLMYILLGFARSSLLGAFNEENVKGIKKIGIIINKKFDIGRFLNISKLLKQFDRIKKEYSFDQCRIIIGDTTTYIKKAIYNKELFLGDRKIEFEGEKFSVPVSSEKILSIIYGLYLELPEEKYRRRSHFSVIY